MAMASAFVDGALQDIVLLGKDFLKKREVEKEVATLRWYLRFLRTFLLCARGCGSSPTGSLLSRLEDSLIQNGKDFHNLCLRQEETRSTGINVDLYGLVMQLNNCIKSFYQEIMESYSILLYCSLQFRYQLKEFFDSLLMNMADIVNCSGLTEEPDPFEAFKDKLEFFINFVRYAELRGLEPCQLQVLFTRLHAVAVNTARLCYQYPFVGYDGPAMLLKEIKLKVSEQLPKIEPTDPQIREIYVHVLTTSNVSSSSHVLTLETDKHVLGDFGDALLSNILKALTYGDSYMVSLKDQVPILFEGLRILRTILTKHLEKIDQLHKNAKDLIRAAINEAAIVICLLPVHKMGDGLVKEMDFAVLNFLERIKLIKVITSAFIFPKSNKHVFIDFLLENLDDMLSCKVDSIAFAKDQIQTVQKDLVFLRSFLENVLDDRKHDGKLQSLWNRVVELACKTHFVLLSLVVGDAPNCSPLKFRTIIEEINLIKLDSLKIVDKHCTSDSKAQKPTNTSNPLPSQCSTPAINETVVTLDKEANTIIEYLTRGQKNLDIISIVGMPGLGKTTLARSVYDSPSVKDLFHASAWCVVSQAYKKKDLLLRILGSVDPEFPSNKNPKMDDDDYLKKDEQWLEEKLRKCLLRRRYLMILDDVWDIEVWSCLERSFPDDANSSRILLTSRDSEVVKKINPSREPHRLRQLTDDECWNLLQKKLSSIKSYPLDLGEKIAKQCRGLPLTVVVIAGILANSEQDSWEEIAEKLSLSALSVIDRCIDILELSFNKLPENLKSCLLYFGLLPEDEEISVRNLIWFWLAEGFIENSEQKSLEDVAKDYINDLISRSLVMVSKERSIGGVKTCRIHDFLHDFCVIKAKRKKFMSLIRGYDKLFTFHGQRDLPRLCIYSTQDEFKHSKISCPGVRSLLFFAVDDGSVHARVSVLLHFFKLLKVLDLRNIQIETLPSEIALLVELRYLAITIESSTIALAAVANLSNLEFLLVYPNCVLPDAIWNMPKLRVIWSPGLILFTALALDNLGNSSDLLNLDIFSTLRLSHGQSLEKTLRKLPNIRRLKCELEESGDSNADCDGHVAMDFLSRLESLHMRCDNDECHIRFRFPLNLKKLTLSSIHSSTIPKSGELPNLVVLKLKYVGGYLGHE